MSGKNGKSVTSIGDLIADPKNARRHNPRNVGVIEDSLQEVGAARSIVIDENNVVLAGNGVLEAAGNVGIEKLQIVDADGETIIAVRRTGLTEAQKKRLALFDNRANELSEWSPDILAQLQAEDEKLLEGLFSDKELTELLKDLDAPKADDPGPQIDRAAELQEKWGTATGQLWEIPSQSVRGKAHRLLCGDSTKAEDVVRLMVNQRAHLLLSDPPYNVGISYGASVNDSLPEDQYETFSRQWFGLWRAVSDRQIVTPGCQNLTRWVRYFQPYHIAPWTKTNALTNGLVSRFWCWEPVTFFGEPDEWGWEGILFFGQGWQRKRANDVFNYPIGSQKEVAGHPCPKPLVMWEEFIQHYAKPGQLIADAFLGSGTTMVAAERKGCLCFGAELESKYVAASLERMAGMGLEPRLLDAVNGRPHE